MEVLIVEPEKAPPIANIAGDLNSLLDAAFVRLSPTQ